MISFFVSSTATQNNLDLILPEKSRLYTLYALVLSRSDPTALSGNSRAEIKKESKSYGKKEKVNQGEDGRKRRREEGEDKIEGEIAAKKTRPSTLTEKIIDALSSRTNTVWYEACHDF